MNAKRGSSASGILVIGAEGQVGWELRRSLATLGKVYAVGRNQLDLVDSDGIRKIIDDLKPELIVNAAAYTSVDRAEAEPELAQAINGVAPGIIGERARATGAAVVHYSTDFVFDGSMTRPYREDDATNPLNVYGRTKLAGEQALLRTGAAVLILRTGWVYGRRGRNFLLTVQKLARDREVLRIVDDQLGSPTWCRLLADATALILSPGTENFSEYVQAHSGVYHLSCAGTTSWCGFARRILELSPQENSSLVHIDAIETSEYPTPATRPPYSVLDNQRMHGRFGICMPDWKTALELALAE